MMDRFLPNLKGQQCVELTAMAALLMMDNGKKCPPFLPQCLPDGYRSFYRVIDSHALRNIRNAGTNEIKLGMYLFKGCLVAMFSKSTELPFLMQQ